MGHRAPQELVAAVREAGSQATSWGTAGESPKLSKVNLPDEGTGPTQAMWNHALLCGRWRAKIPCVCGTGGVAQELIVAGGRSRRGGQSLKSSVAAVRHKPGRMGILD